MLRTPILLVTTTALFLAHAQAEACSCIADANVDRQRAKDVKHADLVFRGRPVRQMVLRPEQWRCDFDERSLGRPSPGCLTVATYGEECEPVFGVKIVVEPEFVLDDKKLISTRTFYSKEPGFAQTCDLPSGKYRIVALTTRQADSRTVHFNANTPTIASVALGKYQALRYRAVFTVDSVDKGKVGKTVEITTWRNDGSCGFGPFEQGQV